MHVVRWLQMKYLPFNASCAFVEPSGERELLWEWWKLKSTVFVTVDLDSNSAKLPIVQNFKSLGSGPRLGLQKIEARAIGPIKPSTRLGLSLAFQGQLGPA